MANNAYYYIGADLLHQVRRTLGEEHAVSQALAHLEAVPATKQADEEVVRHLQTLIERKKARRDELQRRADALTVSIRELEKLLEDPSEAR